MEALGINLPGLTTQVVSFAILFALLYKLLYKPILRILDERSARIKESLEAAERVRQEATESQSDMQQQLEAHRAMAAQIDSSRQGDAADADHATLEVLETIFPRVRLIVGDCEVVFDGALAGPVVIGVSAGGKPSFHQGDGHERPLAEVAEVLRLAA